MGLYHPHPNAKLLFEKISLIGEVIVGFVKEYLSLEFQKDMKNKNIIKVSFTIVIVLIILTLAVASIPAYSNDFIALGTICLAGVGVLTFGWILLSGYRLPIITLLLCLSLIIGIAAYLTGGISDWQRLMESRGVIFGL